MPRPAINVVVVEILAEIAEAILLTGMARSRGSARCDFEGRPPSEVREIM